MPFLPSKHIRQTFDPLKTKTLNSLSDWSIIWTDSGSSMLFLILPPGVSSDRWYEPTSMSKVTSFHFNTYKCQDPSLAPHGLGLSGRLTRVTGYSGCFNSIEPNVWSSLNLKKICCLTTKYSHALENSKRLKETCMELCGIIVATSFLTV